MMLRVYEILFADPPSRDRDERLLEVICDDFETDGAAILRATEQDPGVFEVVAAQRGWTSAAGELFKGTSGLDRFKMLQESAPGALTFTRVKRPAVFPTADWDSFWDDTLSGRAMAMLSVRILPKEARSGYLWVLQSNFSREWSSRDRSLAEEISELLGHVLDRGL